MIRSIMYSLYILKLKEPIILIMIVVISKTFIFVFLEVISCINFIINNIARGIKGINTLAFRYMKPFSMYYITGNTIIRANTIPKNL